MCYNCILLLLTLLLATIGNTLQFQRPCGDLSEECLTKSLQMALPIFAQGIPELGIMTLDPYSIDKLDLVLPGGISLQFRQGVAKGLKDCAVDFARFYNDTSEIQTHCNLTITGKYKSQGRLLVFPVNGDGDVSITCRNIRIHHVFKLRSKVGTDGEKYLEIVKSSMDHSFDGQVSYSFTNLLGGNPELRTAVLDFMNGNWRLVAEEFGGPLVQHGVSEVTNMLKTLLNKVPMNKLVAVPLNI